MGGCRNTARESCKEVDFYLRQDLPETCLAVRWLRLHLPMQGAAGLIPGCGDKIPHASGPKQKKIRFS